MKRAYNVDGSKLITSSSSECSSVANSGANTPTSPVIAQGQDRRGPDLVLKPASLSVSQVPSVNKNGGGDRQQAQFDGQNNNGQVSPAELLNKVVSNNEKQNKRLSAKFNSVGSGSDKANNTKMRFIVCTLGLMSLAMSQMSRMVINLTITQMVDPRMRPAKQDDAKVALVADGSCPWPAEEAPIADIVDQEPAEPSPTPATDSPSEISTTLSSTVEVDDEGDMNDLPDFDDVNDEESGSTPGAVTLPLPSAEPTPEPTESDLSTAVSTIEPLVATNETASSDGAESQQPTEDDSGYDRFSWTIKQQSVIMGGFYYSYFVFMILGGRLAEVYGSKYVILLAVAGSALINLSTPWMARTSFELLVFSRICMGAIQAGVFPAMYALIGKWLTMSEASIYAPLIKMNLRLGMVLGSLIPGIIPGWPNVFYFTGSLSVLWSIAWIIVASSDPADNKWVSEGELMHINRKKKHVKQKEAKAALEVESGEQAKQSKKRSLKTPWLKIWTAPSVLGLIVVKLMLNYALDFLAIELPSYLKYVHHASRQTISAITTPMFGIQVFLIVFVGWLAKAAVEKRPLGMSKTAIRKVFQCTSSYGMALCFFLLTFNDCNLIFVAVMLQIISFLSMFSSGGETMLPYDLSEEYPATIMSIANSIANLSGITTTTLAGFVLGDQEGSFFRWNILIYLIVGANLIGGTTFILLVKAEPIDFSSSKKGKGRANQTKSVDTESNHQTGGQLELVEIKLKDSK